MAEGRVRVGRALAAGSLAAILFLTLRPVPASHVLMDPGLCVVCGRHGLANLLRNVLLFVPLGTGLALAARDPGGGRPSARWTRLQGAVLLLLPALVEASQRFIPGRNPLLADWGANVAGGFLGAALGSAAVARLSRTDPAGTRAAWAVAGVGTVLGLVVLAGTAVAFRPAPPDPPHHVQWTPDLAHFEAYEGRVLSAHVGAAALRVGRLPAGVGLGERLFEGDALSVTFRAGRPPRGLAPVLSVFTGEREEVVVLGVRGSDLVLRLPYLASRLRLDRPDLTLPGALEGTETGGRVEAGARVDPTGACLRAGGVERCRLRPTLASGWALLLAPEWASGPTRVALGFAWLAALAFFPAFFAPGLRGVAGTTALLAGAALLLPAGTGSFATVGVLELFALVTGGALGGGAARLPGGSIGPAGRSVAAPPHPAARPGRVRATGSDPSGAGGSARPSSGT